MSAANPQLYSLFFVVITATNQRTALLAHEQEVDITRNTQSQAVETVALGYAGESPGAPIMEVDVINAIPAGGFEFDAGASMLGLIPASIQVLGPGGKSAKGKAFIISDTVRHGVNQQARYSFRSRMSMQLFQ